MPKKEKGYKHLLIIGILAISIALAGIIILDPPWIYEEPLPEETPDRFQTVLTPEDLQSPLPVPGTAVVTLQSSGAPADTGSYPSVSSSPSQSSRPSARTSGAASPSPSQTESDPAGSPTPVVSHGGGLIATAGSPFTITTDAVEEAGGMKVIKGLRAGGTATLRDIRNNLVSSSSLVRGYREGGEMGGIELVGTGTVVELSDRSGEVVDTAVVLMPGDVLGTGTIEISHLTRLASAVSGDRPLEDVYAMAADIDGSGTIDEEDLDLMAAVLTLKASRRQ